MQKLQLFTNYKSKLHYYSSLVKNLSLIFHKFEIHH